MEEQGKYLNDFMLKYYQGALLDEQGRPIVSPKEWADGFPIRMP